MGDGVEVDIGYERRKNGVFARIGSVRDLAIDAGRARAYPGLVGEAPATLPLYELAVSELTDAKHVMDLGCGAGMGTCVLAAAFERATGVDSNDAALAFAEHIARKARLVRTDLSGKFGQIVKDAISREEPIEIDAACVVDVLSHLDAPFATLNALHDTLADGARVFIAEPAAFPGQTLRAPQRRAFSKRALTSLLAGAGFRVTRWVVSEGTFFACVAERVNDGCERALKAAALASSAEEALSLLEVAARTDWADLRIEAELARANLLGCMGRGDQACSALLAMDPEATDPRPRVALAHMCMRGDTKTAMELALRAVSIDPTDPEARVALAMAEEAANGHADASSWRTISRLAPDSLDVAVKLSNAHITAGNAPLGVAAMERAKAYVSNADVHVATARALVAAGRMADAKIEVDLALALVPGHATAQALSTTLSN